MTPQQEQFSVFLGLGGNLGDPLAAFRRTRLALLEHAEVFACRSSALYRTPAIGGPPGQPDYLNAVLCLQTCLSPRSLLRLCQDLERAEGRQRLEHWGPRTLDIDLLLYGQEVLREEGLEVPHPRLAERLFVLLPLTDLAPDRLHPLLNQSFQALLQKLPADAQIKTISHDW